MRPVLIVHGFLATSSLMRPLQMRLRAHGHDTYLAPELTPMVSRDIRLHADQLDQAVERVRQHTGVDKISVVGASQGGLVALWWAHAHGWDRLDRLVALGSPFRGADTARRVRPLLAPFSTGLAQIVPGSSFLEALTGIALKRPVISVSMNGDRICPPERCTLPGMTNVVVPGSFGWLTHQLLMVDPAAAAAVHEALVMDCAA